jgi:hypothetical protein
MDGALKKKGISLSMQYLNETPLAQIASSRGLFCLWDDEYINSLLIELHLLLNFQ